MLPGSAFARQRNRVFANGCLLAAQLPELGYQSAAARDGQLGAQSGYPPRRTDHLKADDQRSF